MDKATSYVTGDNNQTFQIHGSGNTFEIFPLDKLLELFKEPEKEIKVLVVTLTEEEAKNFPQLKKHLSIYGKDAKDWRPFTDKSIVELLEDFQSKTGFKLKVIFFKNNSTTKLSRKIKEFLETYNQKLVLLLDNQSLFSPMQKETAKKFDRNGIGGLLAINARDGLDMQKHLEDTFDHLFNSIFSYDTCKYLLQEKQGLIQVEFGIKNKATLFRKLVNIITKHLDIQAKGNITGEKSIASRLLPSPSLGANS